MKGYQLWHEEAEMGFLGSLLLLDDAEAETAAESATVEDFWKPSHKVLFTTFRLMVMRGVPRDPVTIKNELVDDGNLEAVGGAGYLINVMEAVPSPRNWEAYLNILKLYAYRRKCEAYAKSILEKTYDDCENVELESLVESGLPQSTSSVEPILLKDISMECSDDAVRSHSPFVNDISGDGGYVKGQVSVIAAGTKGGKSAWMMASAMKAAADGVNVVYALFADLNPQQFKNRMFQHITGRKKAENDADRQILARLETLPIEIYHFVEHGSRLRDLQVFLASRKRKGKEAGIVFVDYIQAIDGDASQSRVGETERISKQLNQMAAKGGYALVVGSQVTQNMDGTVSAKYAKEIEENAALTLQLSPDKDDPENRRKIFAKFNRFGPSYKYIGANWLGKKLMFVEDSL